MEESRKLNKNGLRIRGADKYVKAYTMRDIWKCYVRNRDKSKAVYLNRNQHGRIMTLIIKGMIDKLLTKGVVHLGDKIGFIEIRKRKKEPWICKDGVIRATYPLDYKTINQSRRSGDYVPDARIFDSGYVFKTRFASGKAKVKKKEYLLFRTTPSFRKRLHDLIVEGKFDALI